MIDISLFLMYFRLVKTIKGAGMIALNELLDNLNYYQEMYNKMNFNIDLNYFYQKEVERKNLQLQFENLKASCNKLCNTLAKMKAKKENFSFIFQEILKNEKTLNQMQKDLDVYNDEINKNLRKLPNLPDEFLPENEFIKTNQKSISFVDFINKIDKTLKQFSSKTQFLKTPETKPNLYLSKIKNQVFEEKDSVQKINCGEQILLLIPDYLTKDLINNLLGILKEDALNLKKIKTSLISRSSICEYIAKLNECESVKISLKGEFYTRLYNIKYKNKSIDMTKFLNQINIQKISK